MTIAYLRLKKEVKISEKSDLRLSDIAYISLENAPNVKKQIISSVIKRINSQGEGPYIINAFQVIEKLNRLFPDVEFQIIGGNEVLIYDGEKKKTSVFMAILVWLILFVGTAMTIINFHYDVSMHEVQQKIHYLITGKDTKNPLWMQIPYSLGLGVGMMLFFNHFLKYKFSDDPSPLEIEIYKYDESVRQYLHHKNNELTDEKH